MSNSQNTLPTANLQTNPFQPREKIKDSELKDLVSSISQFGILEPLVIAHTPAGYQIIAGERRWRAAQKLGLKEVPVVIKETSPKGMLEMALVENVQRVDLSAIERAQAFQQLAQNFSFSNEQIAKRIGKSVSYVSNSLRLLHLPDAIKDGLAGRQITEGHARALLGIGNEKVMIDCYKIILKENASVRRAEELSRLFREKTSIDQVAAPKDKNQKVDDPQLIAWKEKIRKLLHIRGQEAIKLTRSMKQTRLTLTFTGPEAQQKIERVLEILEKGAA